MMYRGVILTGTRGAGKTTVLKHLVARKSGFVGVRAVTTRGAREDDAPEFYEYLSETAFAALDRGQELLVDTVYDGARYGIKHSSVDTVRTANRIPVLVITPESVAQLNKKCGPTAAGTATAIGNEAGFLTVFLDASDEELNQRLAGRAGQTISAQIVSQRALDRKFKDSTVYSLLSEDVTTTVDLIEDLWRDAASGGVLSGELIRKMIRCGVLLLQADEQNISPASYDLSLGDEYFYGGRIHRLSDKTPILLIEPYDYAIVTSHEVSALPKDVCGRFDLAVNLFCQGIILSNGPQVDPGFRGPLFCLLFNTSSSPVLLKRRQHYATLEFHKLLRPTEGYAGKYQAKGLLDYLPGNAARGAINELKKEIEEVRRESRSLQNVAWSIMALVFAIIAIWVSFK